MTLIEEKIPENISRLPELAYNLWWSWTPQARDLFRRLDYPLWRSTQHNPVQMLQEISPAKLEEAAHDSTFVRHYNKVMIQFDREMKNGRSWFHANYPQYVDKTIAYFSFEFGLHSSLPIYSGGLGILSGDHAKEASDLGLPFVGVGFMYPQGYFRQRVPSHGWQEAVYQQLDMSQAPVRPVYDGDGNEIRISVNLGGRQIYARVWHVQVGRNPLYLMDTDVDENEPWDRELSARLYSGDSEMRIRQEIMLGIGGVRMLRTLGIQPSVWHMNEGHSAFLTLECIREKVTEGMSFEQACEAVRAQSVFTTHTPVPAGHDAFGFHLIDQYFHGFWHELGINREHFLSLGGHQEEWGMAFNMTVLALRLCGQANGVSQLHGAVSRRMWQEVWSSEAADEVPITSITNGIHIPTWIAGELHYIFDKYLGPDWRERSDALAVWQRIAEVPDAELWPVHMALKRKLMGFLQDRVRRNWIDGRNDPTQVLTSGTLLDPEALTIGFARRFATYKRATLIFHDTERLKRIVHGGGNRPVQFIFAGKAHPRDEPGKDFIREVYHRSHEAGLAGHLIFLEDYDINVGRHMVMGVDVWMNTPRRPLEASGTSGQKAGLNGSPNFSILDGWWDEGFNGKNGWAIGDATAEYATEYDQNHADATSIYDILEKEIVPRFYNRDSKGVPTQWMQIVKESIRIVTPQFSMSRMIKEYTNELYVPSME